MLEVKSAFLPGVGIMTAGQSHCCSFLDVLDAFGSLSFCLENRDVASQFSRSLGSNLFA